MATAPRYDTNVGQPGSPAEPKKSSGCLKGCLIVAVILVVLAIIVGIVVALNWRSWAASGTAAVINQGIDQSSLPAQEKAEVKAEVNRAVEAFREGKMSFEQLGQLMLELSESPLMTMIVVYGIDQQHLNRSGLSEDEKTAGRRSVRRLVRGVVDKKIPEASLDNVLQHIANRQPNGQWQLRQQVSDQDLRAFLAAAKAEADTAQIPEEPEDIDVSAEVKRVIDSVLGGGGG
jgi:hypothetical protein